MHNPFESERGERVRGTMLQLLAAAGGAAGDFAEDVLAGRRQPHELLAHGPVLDEFVQEARGWWQVIDALPAEQRQRLAADAWTSLEQQVDELADLDVDAAIAELCELAARTPETEPPQDQDSHTEDEDDDWSDRTFMRRR